MLLSSCFESIYLRIFASTSEKSEIGSWEFQIKKDVRERLEAELYLHNRDK